MYVIRVLHNISLLLCLFITGIKSKCTTTYFNECEKASDVERYGQKTWENLIISHDKCGKGSTTINEVLKAKALAKAANIEELFIFEKLMGIESDAFNGLNRLTHIKFNKNQIKVLPKGSFANLNAFKVDLQYNSIENIEHGLFANSSIAFINLSHNKLNNIQVDYVDLSSLQKLVITNNAISYLAENCFHENLEHLNLAHNSIPELVEGVLKPLRNLKELNLSYNRLKGIALSYGLPNLETFDLSHNQIVNVNEGSFHPFLELKHLKLSHNYITIFNYNVFAVGNSITSLHLHYNAFMQLQNSVGQILTELRELTVSGNPWACPCLAAVASYIGEHNITQPDCDRQYFSVGKSAVCVITGDECTFEETLTDEHFQNFRKSLKLDFCDDL